MRRPQLRAADGDGDLMQAGEQALEIQALRRCIKTGIERGLGQNQEQKGFVASHNLAI